MEKDKNIPIFVTGGTGFVGSYLLRYLIREGYTQVRALKRPQSSLELVGEAKDAIQWIEGDVLDPFSLEEAMQGIHTVLHCAAAVSYQPAEKNRIRAVNVNGTANVVNEALEAGVKKMIFTGSIAALGYPQEGFLADEKTPWVWKKELSHYAVSKYQAEMEVWRGAAEGLEVCVVHPSIILGAGRWNDGALKVFPLVWKNFPICPPGKNGFVDVRDVALFIIRLMEQNITGERFIVSSENVAFLDVMRMLAVALSRRSPTFVAPGWLLTLAHAWNSLQSLFTGQAGDITREAVYHASVEIGYNNQKSVEALDWQYIPIAQTIAEAGQLFKESVSRGMEPSVFKLDKEV
jgi:dihydroflavonol-4-reductase